MRSLPFLQSRVLNLSSFAQVLTNKPEIDLSPEGKPWDRLYRTATLSSSRREVFHHDPQVRSKKVVTVQFPLVRKHSAVKLD